MSSESSITKEPSTPKRNTETFDNICRYQTTHDGTDLGRAANLRLCHRILVGVGKQYIERHGIWKAETMDIMMNLAIEATQFVRTGSPATRTFVKTHQFDWVEEGATVELFVGTGPNRPGGVLFLARQQLRRSEHLVHTSSVQQGMGRCGLSKSLPRACDVRDSARNRLLDFTVRLVREQHVSLASGPQEGRVWQHGRSQLVVLFTSVSNLADLSFESVEHRGHTSSNLPFVADVSRL